MTKNEKELGAAPAEGEPAATSSSTSENGYTHNQAATPEKSPNTTNHSIWRKTYDVITWTPPRCRWDPAKPPEFSLGLNILFGFAGAFTVANLYYNHPILNILAHDFNVPYERVSQIPTVMQAGYAAGLLFLCPLGDVFRRRAFILLLVLFTATFWIGLCITTSFATFTAISFITAVTTVTPQLALPLVGDLAPPHRRASALSIVVSGLALGILIARVLSGTLTQYVSWRSIYWLSLALQYLILGLLWLYMPDYPSTNPGGLPYLRVLWSILVMVTKHPVLVQACVVSFFTSATFTSFWTTLTFLLAGPPYHYTPLVIGLFALIGISAMVGVPLYARLVTDRFVPLFSVIVGELMCLLGVTIGTYTGTFTVAGPVVQAFFNDLGMQTAQIANRSAIYSIEPKARNRLNTAFMVATFCGQLTGTAVGSHLYARGGWVRSGSASVGFIGAALMVCFARGPWETRWVGWCGGWSMRKKDAKSADGRAQEGPVHGDGSSGDVEKGEGKRNTERAVEELAGEDGENPLREIRDREEEGRQRVDGDLEESAAASEKSASEEGLPDTGQPQPSAINKA